MHFLKIGLKWVEERAIKSFGKFGLLLGLDPDLEIVNQEYFVLLQCLEVGSPSVEVL